MRADILSFRYLYLIVTLHTNLESTFCFLWGVAFESFDPGTYDHFKSFKYFHSYHFLATQCADGLFTFHFILQPQPRTHPTCGNFEDSLVSGFKNFVLSQVGPHVGSLVIIAHFLHIAIRSSAVILSNFIRV